jgi:hypothetical protein
VGADGHVTEHLIPRRSGTRKVSRLDSGPQFTLLWTGFGDLSCTAQGAGHGPFQSNGMCLAELVVHWNL